MSRRQAREDALKLLYLRDLCGSDGAAAETIIYNGEAPAGEMLDFVREIFGGVASRVAEIDARIEKYSENWTLDRMNIVDKNILRLAVYELLGLGDTPPKVVINEAVELAKTFSGDKAKLFINGVLDKIKDSPPFAASCDKPR
ncbi:MAG: transcription antitermination factor NusB [Endomicrobiia bacterium]|nr:transcription antitermination factor NusB [Endomicrobiia bacterium]